VNIGIAISDGAGPAIRDVLGHGHSFARRGRRHMLVCFAAGGLWSTGLPDFAVANPPPGGGRSLLSTIDSVRFASPVRDRSGVHQEKTSVSALDLRLPIDSMSTVTSSRATVASHSGDDLDDPLARPNSREATFPVMRSPEVWLRRVHREGVPIVRLWNSKSALLSIGLNQKGKPGLWLIQKVP
jgi:hypothetical protein